MAKYTRAQAVEHIEMVAALRIDMREILPDDYVEAANRSTEDALRIGYIVGICSALDLSGEDFEVHPKVLH